MPCLGETDAPNQGGNGAPGTRTVQAEPAYERPMGPFDIAGREKLPAFAARLAARPAVQAAMKDERLLM